MGAEMPPFEPEKAAFLVRMLSIENTAGKGTCSDGQQQPNTYRLTLHRSSHSERSAVPKINTYTVGREASHKEHNRLMSNTKTREEHNM